MSGGRKDETFSIPEEKPLEIDNAITQVDMLSIIHGELKRKQISGHHLNSMNQFYEYGIKQITSQVFKVEGSSIYDPKDKDMGGDGEVKFVATFSNIRIEHPKQYNNEVLLPNKARKNNLNYSGKLKMDITVKATLLINNDKKDVYTKEDTLKDKDISHIPCMLKSVLCHTKALTRDSLKKIEEDPNDPGGYFIISGTEWCVDNLENIANNMFHVFANKHRTEIARGNFISKPGDDFENSYQIILRYNTNDSITVEVYIAGKEFKTVAFPFFILFRALGMSGDKDILDNILYGVDNQDKLSQDIRSILLSAYEANVDKHFDPIKNEKDQNKILDHIAMRFIYDPKNINVVLKNDEARKHMRLRVLNTLDTKFLPHVGTTPNVRIQKLKYLGFLINRLLSVHLGAISDTDRDSYKNKRIHSAGTSLAKTFRTAFNLHIVHEMRSNLEKHFENTKWSQTDIKGIINESIKGDNLQKLLISSLKSGAETIQTGTRKTKNRVSSQQLHHRNDLNVASTLNNINAPSGSGVSKQKGNERADNMRRVQGSYPGYVDISQSADSGEKVGMTKQMACTASICPASESLRLKQILRADKEIILLENTKPSSIISENLAKVFVNGHWIGCCREAHNIARKYRIMRRYGHLIDPFTTIFWELSTREVHFWVDEGRLTRPLIIVYNNIDAFLKADAEGKPIKFKQWIKLTREHLIRLRAGELTMDNLREMQVIEYISPEESENIYCAMSIDTLRENCNDPTMQFTHCDVPQAIFGIVTLASPLGNHSNATRNTFYTNHRRQSCGWFSLNWPHRIIKHASLQHYCERPIISCFSDQLTNPNGQNCMVAMLMYGGYNQEDSIIMNKTSVDRGLFNLSYFNYMSERLEANEQFGDIVKNITKGVKPHAVYDYLENGIIKVGTRIKENYVLIGKYATLSREEKEADGGKMLYVDRSMVYREKEEGIVDDVIQVGGKDPIIKVRIRYARNIIEGDKCASRHGNKGIVAKQYTSADMPFTTDGTIADVVINPHSIPSRMAINQLIECLSAILASIEGHLMEATPFINIDIAEVSRRLAEHGFKKGIRKMINGKTGEMMDALVLIGPTCYQRLDKFVLDKFYAGSRGSTNALTKQPLGGRSNQGGLKLGEMEKDVHVSHGTMRALCEKYGKDSDGTYIYICRNCKRIAYVNEDLNKYICFGCEEKADIARVASSWCSNIFIKELKTMNIETLFELEPFMQSLAPQDLN